jgi:hypothetical protein
MAIHFLSKAATLKNSKELDELSKLKSGDFFEEIDDRKQ